jgi:hypothetical protein
MQLTFIKLNFIYKINLVNLLIDHLLIFFVCFPLLYDHKNSLLKWTIVGYLRFILIFLHLRYYEISVLLSNYNIDLSID